MTQTLFMRFRKEAKLTQEAVGEALGCSRDRVRRWEKGAVDVPTSAIPVLASLYKRSPEEILQSLTNPPESPEVPNSNS